jgi:hypothetical protein
MLTTCDWRPSSDWLKRRDRIHFGGTLYIPTAVKKLDNETLLSLLGIKAK